MPCVSFDRLPHVVVDLHVKDVRDQIQCILVILYFGVEASEIEAVCQIVLIDLAKVFIPSRGYKLNRKLAGAILPRIHEWYVRRVSTLLAEMAR